VRREAGYAYYRGGCGAAGLQGETRVLFKTRNSTLLKVGVYDASFAPFSVDGAKALVDLGLKLVDWIICQRPRPTNRYRFTVRFSITGDFARRD